MSSLNNQKQSQKNYALFPIKDVDSWDFYQKQKRCLWTVDEITHLDQDIKEFADDEKINEDMRKFILMVLSFFACSDAIVNEFIFERIINNSMWSQPTKMFYAAQLFIETIHNETYNILIESLCSATPELQTYKMKLFNGIDEFKSIQDKANWFKEMGEKYKDNIGGLLFLQACVEGIHFSSSFACIFFFKTLNILPGVVTANHFIVRDEGLHRDFAILQHSKLSPDIQLSESEAHAMVKEAVYYESLFVKECLPVPLLGINEGTMCDYVKHVANHLLLSAGFSEAYIGVKNPFSWMEMISLENKTNFFEHNTTEYAALKNDRDESLFDETF